MKRKLENEEIQDVTGGYEIKILKERNGIDLDKATYDSVTSPNHRTKYKPKHRRPGRMY